MNDDQTPHSPDTPPAREAPRRRTLRYTYWIQYHDREYPECITDMRKAPNIIGGVVFAYDVYKGDTITTHCIPLTSIKKYTVTQYWD